MQTLDYTHDETRQDKKTGEIHEPREPDTVSVFSFLNPLTLPKTLFKTLLKLFIRVFKSLFFVVRVTTRATLYSYLKFHYDRFQDPRNLLDLYFRLAVRFLLILYTTAFLFLIAGFMAFPAGERGRYLVSCLAPVYLFTRKKLTLYYLSVITLIIYIGAYIK